MEIQTIIDILIGLSTIALTLTFSIITNLSNKRNLSISIFSNINTAKSALDSVLYDNTKYCHQIKDDGYNAYGAVCPVVEDYFNAFEMACSLYNSKKIDRKMFISLYKADLFNICGETDFKNYFDEMSTQFPNIISVYNQVR